ncbi:hypothetical protein ACFV7Q_20420 [Streptomyces sp. NPDC059851]|uniref:hypothetical protein n=1 Tax=Streptomyces sp. NPDC059851 TaxID=3346971 RepID=UPI00365F48F6
MAVQHRLVPCDRGSAGRVHEAPERIEPEAGAGGAEPRHRPLVARPARGRGDAGRGRS